MRATRSTIVVTATALLTLALSGGLSGTLIAQDEDTVQGASDEAAVFEGRIGYLIRDRSGTSEALPEGRLVKRGESWEGYMDYPDSRLSGTERLILNEDFHVSEDGVSSVFTSSRRIDNAEGSWVGDFTGYSDIHGMWHFQGLLTGTGAYEGMHAILIEEETGSGSGGGAGYDVQGVIFPGALPETPEYPEATG